MRRAFPNKIENDVVPESGSSIVPLTASLSCDESLVRRVLPLFSFSRVLFASDSNQLFCWYRNRLFVRQSSYPRETRDQCRTNRVGTLLRCGLQFSRLLLYKNQKPLRRTAVERRLVRFSILFAVGVATIPQNARPSTPKRRRRKRRRAKNERPSCFSFLTRARLLTVRTTQKIAMGKRVSGRRRRRRRLRRRWRRFCYSEECCWETFFVCLVGGFWLWCLSFFLSFFLSFSVQNSFFHFYLLLARYEKRIKNQGQNKIVIFSH